MPSQNEKERRKQILHALAKKQEQEFETSLPMSREQFKELFDFLDMQLGEWDDTLRLTKLFLSTNKIEAEEKVIEWLTQHSGYCDCEVLANVEELFN